MNVSIIEQLTSLSLLIDLLLGITFGVVGGAVYGSRRGPATDNLASAGARVIYRVYARDDDGYLRGLLHGNSQASDDPHGDDSSESNGQESHR